MAYPKIVYGAGQSTNPNTHQPASSVERYFEVSLLLMLGRGALEFTRLYNALRFGQTPVPVARLLSALEEISRKTSYCSAVVGRASLKPNL